jgi:predicted nicotinamide N-methyase
VSEPWIEEVVPLDGLDLVVRRPPDAEALIDEAAFEKDELLPYWAELWPSGLALARSLRRRALRGARVLELGCGLGIPSIVAALSGAKATATDWSEDALAAVRGNAEANDADVATLVADWRQPDAIVAAGPWDLVIGADILYEARNIDLVLHLVEAIGAPALIADPGRQTAGAFFERAEERFVVDPRRDPEPPHAVVHALRPRA